MDIENENSMFDALAALVEDKSTISIEINTATLTSNITYVVKGVGYDSESNPIAL